MTRFVRRLTASVITLAFCVACSTKLTVAPSKPMAGSGPMEVKGIPFREARSHTIHLYAFNSASQKYEKISEEERVIASPDAVYYLAADPDWFSNRTLKLKFTPSGTIKTLDLSSESKAKATADALLGEIEKLQTAAEAEDTAAQTESDTLKKNELACVQAESDLAISEAELAALTSTATEVQRVTAQGKVNVDRKERDNACNN